MGDVQITNITTQLEGFDDPLVGRVSFEKFDDPLVGLEKMQRTGEVSGRAQSNMDRHSLEITPDIEEMTFTVNYREPNSILKAFRQARPVAIHTRKAEDGYEMRFKTDKTKERAQ